jgi:serine/threonine-protein kinase OSR1/STK39
MTLQNAPPGLDYERDRRFSKVLKLLILLCSLLCTYGWCKKNVLLQSFKEMVAMCLVKDPSKRPSAEKLLKHSFFKHVKSGEYIARTILDPLPPLWQRVRDVKVSYLSSFIFSCSLYLLLYLTFGSRSSVQIRYLIW